MGSRKRILIVDDHAAARQAARRLLAKRSEWVICDECENGVEAVEKAAALKPDLVILDLSMPKMNGLEAARIIHGASPTLPLLLFSINGAEVQVVRDVRMAGFQGSVSKATGWLLPEAVELLLEGKTFFHDDNGAFPEPEAGAERVRRPADEPQNGEGTLGRRRR